MTWDILEQGFVVRQHLTEYSQDIAIGPRVVVLPDGEAICSFMFTAKTATNDFVPALCRSKDYGRTWHEPGLVYPLLGSRWAHFVGISRDPRSRRVYLYGTRTKIDVRGESNWSAPTQGLKANEL